MVRPRLVIDSREQRPWDFGEDVETVRATLYAGDYSIEGFETRVAIERKSLDDFVACCTRERQRFERELVRLASYDFAAVIVEADVGDIAAHRYVSRASPSSVIGSAVAFTIDHVPVMFGGRRELAARLGLRFLQKFHERQIRAEKAAA